MKIEDKDIGLLGKQVYNKTKDKFGYISSIDISYGIGGYYMSFNVYYDTFEDRNLTSFEDFEKGDIQFVILKDPIFEEYSEHIVNDIKQALEEKFYDTMILYVTEDEKKAKDYKNDTRNTQMLHTDLVSLTDISAEVMSDDFYSRELYLKYKRGVISETELLYALVNHLSQELDRIQARNRDYFFKYEFLKEIGEENDDEET